MIFTFNALWGETSDAAQSMQVSLAPGDIKEKRSTEGFLPVL
jgi:hypothetical protein